MIVNRLLRVEKSRQQMAPTLLCSLVDYWSFTNNQSAASCNVNNYCVAEKESKMQEELTENTVKRNADL